MRLSLQQGVEREALPFRNDDLAVEDEGLRRELAERLDQLREVAAERLAGLGLEEHLPALPESQAAEAVPLRLVKPPRAGRDLRLGFRLHGRKRWPDRQVDLRKFPFERLGGNRGSLDGGDLLSPWRGHAPGRCKRRA
jgi:hypothetical protein